MNILEVVRYFPFLQAKEAVSKYEEAKREYDNVKSQLDMIRSEKSLADENLEQLRTKLSNTKLQVFKSNKKLPKPFRFSLKTFYFIFSVNLCLVWSEHLYNRIFFFFSNSY